MKVYYSKPRKTNLSIDKQTFSSLVSEAVKISGLKVSETAAIVINFVSERQICSMNSEHMHHEGITDVISFSYLADEDIDKETGIFAEIFVCVRKAEIEAMERKIEFADELILYVIHGILHIANYDDLDSASRKKMRQAEARCMKHLKKKFDLKSVITLQQIEQ